MRTQIGPNEFRGGIQSVLPAAGHFSDAASGEPVHAPPGVDTQFAAEWVRSTCHLCAQKDGLMESGKCRFASRSRGRNRAYRSQGCR